MWSEAISFIEIHTSNRGLLHSISLAPAGVRNDVSARSLRAISIAIAGTRDDGME